MRTRARRNVGLTLFIGALVSIGVGCLGTVNRLYDDATLQPQTDASNSEVSSALPDVEAGPSGPATIGGKVIGLTGSGLVLQNNAGDDLEIPAVGPFTFPLPVAFETPYAVTVRSQPMEPTQTCEVTHGTGTARGVNVGDVVVSCGTNTYPVGGTVVGLVGSGLVLQNNDANDLPIAADGTFMFSQPIASGSDFKVSIKTQPSGPSQTCSVSGETGKVVAAAVDSVVVNCGTDTYTVGGMVTGLSGTLVLRNNGKNDRTISANGTYAFSVPVSSGGGYNVTIQTQPTYPPSAQTCTLANASGTVGSSNVTNVNVSCNTNKYTVGGTVTGLIGGGLVLRNNGGDDKAISGNGGFTFGTSVASASAYSVTVKTQPAGQQCSVSSGAGTVTSSNVSTVSVKCIPAENFDRVTAPALPAGWSSRVATGQNGDSTWVTTTTNANSAPNAAYVPAYNHRTNIQLDSPPIPITRANATLSFWTRYETEAHNDGCVLEISIAGGAFDDILDAGGSFVSGGYNDTINTLFSTSTIAGHKAWSGTGVTPVVVNLPAAASGQNIVLRWRMGTDSGTAGGGWWIDSIVVNN